MIYENEIIMLVLGLGVLIFAFVNYGHLKRIRSFKVLIAGFFVLVVGWVLTVLEPFFWYAFCNLLEHACYAVGAMIAAFWFWRVFGKAEEGG